MEDKEILLSVHQIELSLTELKVSHTMLKTEVLEHLKYTIGNLHTHMKDQLTDIRSQITTIKYQADENHKEKVSKADLVHYVSNEQCGIERNKCANGRQECLLEAFKHEQKYLTKSEAWKWLITMVIIVSGIWAVVQAIFPALQLIFK